MGRPSGAAPITRSRGGAVSGDQTSRRLISGTESMAPSSGIPSGAAAPSSGAFRPNRMSVPLTNGAETQRNYTRGGFGGGGGGGGGNGSGLVRGGGSYAADAPPSSGIAGAQFDDRTVRGLNRMSASASSWNGGGGGGNWRGGGGGGGNWNGGGGNCNWNNNSNWCGSNWNNCSSGSNWSVSIGFGSWNSWCSPSWGWNVGWGNSWCAPRSCWSTPTWCSPYTGSWWSFGTGGWWSSGLGWGWSVGTWAVPVGCSTSSWSVSAAVPLCSSGTCVDDGAYFIEDTTYAPATISTTAFTVGAFDDVPGYDSTLEARFASLSAAQSVNPEVQREAQRAERALLAKVNPHYDVVPDFATAVGAAAGSEYSEAISAMRRAALVNPEALVGAQTKIARDIASDPDRAQRVRYALGVFQNPPRRVVSEADAHFMVAAFTAALGDDSGAAMAIDQARQAGDRSASTELLSRAITTDDLKNRGAWVTGSSLK